MCQGWHYEAEEAEFRGEKSGESEVEQWEVCDGVYPGRRYVRAVRCFCYIQRENVVLPRMADGYLYASELD